ncbi:MAG: putative DNA binding domain-containing protein, partial [Kistimonas sp.]|nr:putative DNA binding domain-containing protein [Kistimonas sp.]
MLTIETLEDIAAMQESLDVECKLAQGRDGKGAIPKDMWETYSAFANTHGGNIFLGLRETANHSFEAAGIADTPKVLKELWDTLNNPQKVSACIVREHEVQVLNIAGKSLIHIQVPAASRKQKPVYIKGNPLSGTYRRFNSGDMQVSEENVRRMMAEQLEDSRDAALLKNYGIDDLDSETLNAYRNMYSARQPDHPWNKVDLQEFLYQIGAWGKDRETGDSGLTRAGLLMFGRWRPVKEAFPHYMVDYQDSPEAKGEARWVDRLVPDGSWSGNLFDFYQKVIRKLTADLKVPFVLAGDQRQDDTPVHKALREALVNTLIHADYSGRVSVLVVKRPDMFSFRNPGAMRVAVEDAIAGSISDCRNRALQDMFRYVGLGESAGSGLPKIFAGWDSQHWRKPLLKQRTYPSEQTLLELHTLSLIPDHILEHLRTSLGEQTFDSLEKQAQLILITAHIETTVDHARMMSILDIHPRDLSALLASLVEKKLLYQEGSGRGTIYFTAQAMMKDRELEQVLGLATQPGFGADGERSGAQGERSGAQGERSGAQGERSGAQGERSAAQGERSAAQGERSAAQGERSAAQGERSAAQG